MRTPTDRLGPAAATPQSMALVVTAAVTGTTFEWYDFFLFVPLATIISKTFFSGLADGPAYIFALLSFAAGFAARPFGALIFGRVGDRMGRKGTFLITIVLMGAATFAIALLPTFAQVGPLAPILFVGLRVLQGLALGGEWGGAAIYIGEHAPVARRGYWTSWIGTSAAFGLAAALVVVLVTRGVLGEAPFAAWGWRIPFLFSAVLLAISVYIRAKLHESPVFESMRDKGERSARPYAEAFGSWTNLRLVLITLFGVMTAQGAIWYAVFFYAQTFMERIVHAPAALVNGLMIAVVLASAPLYVLSGWLSDRFGRKPVMVFGVVLATLALYPCFVGLTRAGNPAMAAAMRAAPVTVFADPATCSVQFDPVGKARFTTSCDIAKSTLAAAGVSYRNAAAPTGSLAEVRVGATSVNSVEGGGLNAMALKAAKASAGGRIKAELAKAGYPANADPARVEPFALFLLMMALSVGACFLYGPQAACLAELFPARVRYTALSLPYHIGTGWVGGFLPATAYAIVAATGNIYMGLSYPIVAATIAAIVMHVFLPETRGRDLNAV